MSRLSLLYVRTDSPLAYAPDTAIAFALRDFLQAHVLSGISLFMPQSSLEIELGLGFPFSIALPGRKLRNKKPSFYDSFFSTSQSDPLLDSHPILRPFLPNASSLIAILISLQACSVIPARTVHSDPQTMKVHPVPRKRNITIQYDINARNPLSEAQALLGLTNKKLRRLPHVFSRVLELPFRSDADVMVEESPDFFRFVAETDGIGDVQAHMVEIHPGVTKIVVRESGSLELSLDELELDIWRFRLPESTRPELASAVFVDGELIVTVPKSEELENSEDENGGMWNDGNGNFGGRLVLVQ